MIKDKQMIDLGFKKVKKNKTRKNGISSYVWENDSCILTIEKDSFDNDDLFYPTLRTGNYIKSFKNIEGVKKLIEALEYI